MSAWPSIVPPLPRWNPTQHHRSCITSFMQCLQRIPPTHQCRAEIESSESHRNGATAKFERPIVWGTLYFVAASAMAPEPGSPPSISHSAGSFRRQRTPSGAKTRSTVPPNSYGIRSQIVLVPYPELAAATTGGPPISRHSSVRNERECPFIRRSHRTETRPCLAESAPYFAAL